MEKNLKNDLGDFDSIIPHEYHEDHLQTKNDFTKTLDNLLPLCFYTQPSPSHPRKCPRRRIKSQIGSCCLLALTRSANGKIPKKEYVRCRMIRGHKRALRQVESNITPSTTINKIDPINAVQMAKWQEFADDYLLDKESLSEIARTDQGPATDGIAKRAKSADEVNLERSFNNDYCRTYFTSMCVRRSFGKYCEVLFADENLTMLGKKFQINCCGEDNHKEICKIKWANFKVYLQTTMITELEGDLGTSEHIGECDEDSIEEELYSLI